MSDAAMADFNKLTDDLLAEHEEIREQMRNGTLQTYSTMEGIQACHGELGL